MELTYGATLLDGATRFVVWAPNARQLSVRVHTGESDDAGRVLQGTELHVADQIASAAELVVGPFGGVPGAIVRGVAFERSAAGAAAGLMPAERDLFRNPNTAE